MLYHVSLQRSVFYVFLILKTLFCNYSVCREGYGTRLTIYNLIVQDEGTYACKKFYNQTAKQEFPIEMVGE